MEREFLEKLESDVLSAGHALLGAHLVRGTLRARIVEVEAYRTPDDPGCHAHNGMTPRNKVLYGPPGFTYVYFNYGVHWMLNVVAHPQGNAAALLIRAAVPLQGQAEMHARRSKAKKDRDLLSGPGKLAQAFGITGDHNGLDLFSPESDIRIEIQEPVAKIAAGPRIGLAVGKGETLPWRFVDASATEWLSRPI